VDDQADIFNDTWTSTASSVTRSLAATVHYQRIDDVILNGGSGNETYNVNGTESIFSTTLNTGNGNDIVNVDGTSGALVVNLGGGTDSVNITPTARLLDAIQ